MIVDIQKRRVEGTLWQRKKKVNSEIVEICDQRMLIKFKRNSGEN